MIIVGAKGFAKEVLQIVAIENKESQIYMFDDVSKDISDMLYDKFPVLNTISKVKDIFQKTEDKRFVLGIGTPKYREILTQKFEKQGGELTTIIAKNTQIGSFDVQIGDGSTIMSGAIITNSIIIGKGCLVNLNCTIGHDCVLGDFVELSPNVNISGRCSIGKLTSIGTNAIVIPDIKIGENCIIGAGTIVTKNVPDNSVVVGVPGKVIRKNTN